MRKFAQMKKRILISLTKNIMLKNIYNTKYKKKCLFVFALRPFVNNRKIIHSNYYEAMCISKTISDMGYDIDVIYLGNEKNIDTEKYKIIIGLGNAFFKCLMNSSSDCLKIFYATGSYFINDEYNELIRWINLYQRKGFSKGETRLSQIKNREYAVQTLASCDAILGVGGKWARRTYSIFNIPYFYVGTTAISHYKFSDFNRIIENVKTSFLCMVGKGYIHKGVDMIIEAFSKHEELTLYLAGGYDEDFFDIYKSELNNKNILYVGFLDAHSKRFFDICNCCAYIISASCSEGTCTSVLTGMATGLIPIMTEIEGIDDCPTTRYLEEISVEGIEKVIVDTKSFSIVELKNNMKLTSDYIDENFSLASYERRVSKVLKTIVEE